MGAPPPTRTCPTFTPYVLRRGWRLETASNPSICVSIPLNSIVIWAFQEIESACDGAQFQPNHEIRSWQASARERLCAVYQARRERVRVSRVHSAAPSN